MSSQPTKLTSLLSVFRGHINIGIIRDGKRVLLIDLGDGRVIRCLDEQQIDTVLLTHHHRDQACGAHLLAGTGARIVVPEDERRWFEKVDAYWSDPANRWHVYGFHPSRLMLTEPVPVDAALADGDALDWGRAHITAVATPGHTDGSMSYLVEIEGKRIIFCGDLIYGPGKLWEIYSLQKGITTRDYHGFLGAKDELMASLRRLESLAPDVLVPSHGEIIGDPSSAIDELEKRLRACYDNYARVSAARHYFPDMLADYINSPQAMPISERVPPPEFVRRIGRSWMIISETGAAFVMDCESEGVVAELRRLISEGEIASVEGLWITHYHDDHVDAVPVFQQAFECETIADESVAQVVTDPLAWRLPCLSPSVSGIDRRTQDGEAWRWREFTMTAYHFPGQTLHHGALLVEGRGLRMLFAGDSFAPSGMDDYCLQNRNFLGRGVGYDRCIRLLRELKPDLIFNPHIALPFAFSNEQCRTMLAGLAEREKLFSELLPWDNPNYGLDESWVRCHPHEQHVRPGAEVRLNVVVTNHSDEEKQASAKIVTPRSWPESSQTMAAVIPAKAEGRVSFSLRVPEDAAPRRYVLPVDITYGGVYLPQFAEAVVVVG